MTRRRTFIDNGIRCRKPKNGPEGAFFEFIRKEGWTCTKRGMPDFACYKDGKLILVEVKPKNKSKLKTEQRILLSHLVELGIDCFIWSPDDEKLKKVRG